MLLYQLFDNNSWLMKQINGAFNTSPAGETTAPADTGGSTNNPGNEIVLEVGGTPLSPERHATLAGKPHKTSPA